MSQSVRHEVYGEDEFENEEEYVDWIEDTFQSLEWETWREVYSESGNSRADLIVYHDNWGTFGFECKYDGRPSKMAKALKQLQRYANDNFTPTVDAWSVAENTPDNRGLWKEFFNAMGFGYLRHKKMIEISFNNSSPMINIPVGNGDHQTEEVVKPPLWRIEECLSYPWQSYIKESVK